MTIAIYHIYKKATCRVVDKAGGCVKGKLGASRDLTSSNRPSTYGVGFADWRVTGVGLTDLSVLLLSDDLQQYKKKQLTKFSQRVRCYAHILANRA